MFRNSSATAFLTVVIAVFAVTGYAANRFTISPDGSTFVADGAPVRLISGGFHYFRAIPAQWDARLAAIAASGANAVQTYVAWNWHCRNFSDPTDCDFGARDPATNLTRFIELAQRNGLYVILRPGPYICAEWDLGGFPAWLIARQGANASTVLRTNDPRYMTPVTTWFENLLPRLVPQLYENGGPIVMAQVENEYGSRNNGDKHYLVALRDLMRRLLGPNVILHSTDPFGYDNIARSAIPDVFQVVDFFYWGTAPQDMNVSFAFETQHSQSKLGVSRAGPSFNGEFYPGWLTTFFDATVLKHTLPYVINLVKQILVDATHSSGLNFYMFFGGTNFGLWPGNYVQASYDYGAPLNESGHFTPMFDALANLLPMMYPSNQSTRTTRQAQPPPPLSDYGTVTFTDVGLRLSDPELLANLSSASQVFDTTTTTAPLPTLEDLGESFGAVSYELDVYASFDTITLTGGPASDYVSVFADGEFAGFLMSNYRSVGGNNTLYFAAPRFVNRLTLFVTSNGRVNIWELGDTSGFFKGLLGPVVVSNSIDSTSVALTIGRARAMPLSPETLQRLTFPGRPYVLGTDGSSPRILRGVFNITASNSGDGATLLDMRGWGRGLVFVNGFNLGRYWIPAGPQMSLYCPRELLNAPGLNEVIVVEELAVPQARSISFSSTNYNY